MFCWIVSARYTCHHIIHHLRNSSTAHNFIDHVPCFVEVPVDVCHCTPCSVKDKLALLAHMYHCMRGTETTQRSLYCCIWPMHSSGCPPSADQLRQMPTIPPTGGILLPVHALLQHCTYRHSCHYIIRKVGISRLSTVTPRLYDIAP